MEIDGDEPMEVDEQEGIASSIAEDLWKLILSYCNCVDSCRLETVCKHLFSLVHQCQSHTAPQLAASKGNTRDCLVKLSCPPTLAICTGCSSPPQGISPSTVVCGIQQIGDNDINDGGTTEELLMMTYSRNSTKIVPFCDTSEQSMSESLMDTSLPLSLVFLFGCQQESEPIDSATRSNIDSFVWRVQRTHPNATIVGGTCRGGFVSLPVNSKYSIKRVRTGIFGVAFSGFYPPAHAREFVCRSVVPNLSFGPYMARPQTVLVKGRHELGRCRIRESDLGVFGEANSHVDSAVLLLFAHPPVETSYRVQDTDETMDTLSRGRDGKFVWFPWDQQFGSSMAVW